MFPIHPDIRHATTLPGSFYTLPEILEQTRSTLFPRTWQLIAGAEEQVRLPLDAMPFSFMPGFIDEPLLLLRDAADLQHCLSNVCTHRGKILVEHPGRLDRGITCGYHGRRFHLDGRFQSMPEMEGVENFPCADDNLSAIPMRQWRQFIFCSLEPTIDFEEWIRPMDQKIGFLPLEQFRFAPMRSRDYLVKANWALYCDNYLEGFHIPFVHKSLHAALEWNAYRTELHAWSSCQVGIARGTSATFDLPAGHEDHGQEIAAYYFWLFPNIMFNFYPWGLSLNLVQPIAPNLTRVGFRSYVWDASKLAESAGAELDLVEREDEAVVESVQTGVQSRFYRQGRFSPAREPGVHHFHRLISQMWR